MSTWAVRSGARLSGFSDAAWFSAKLTALAMMVLDHVDWLLYAGRLGFHDSWGRTVFPLFALVLARNLARADSSHMLRVVAPRMVAVGLLAAPAYVYLAGWYPLNIMFTLAAAVAIHACWYLGWRFVSLALFLVGGFLVDYQWFGLACVLLSAWAMRRGSWPVLVHVAAMAALLWPVNGNLWALAAALLFAVCGLLEGPAPRWKWFFYVLYPAHLVVLAIASVP